MYVVMFVFLLLLLDFELITIAETLYNMQLSCFVCEVMHIVPFLMT